MTTGKDIPREIAIMLCDEIRSENKKGWFSIWRLQCFFCYKFAKGDVEKLCLSSEGGCSQVNKRYNLNRGHKYREVSNEQ